MERTFCHPRCACFSSPESHVWHTRDGRTEDQVAYLEKLFGLQADDALTSVDASGTNLSLDANELSKADTPTKEPADAEASKPINGEELPDQAGSVLAGL